MAEEKKPDKKEKPKGWDFDPIELFILLIFISAVGSGIIGALILYFESGEISFYGYRLSNFVQFIKDNAFFFRILGFGVVGASALGTFVLNKKGDAIWRAEKAKLYPEKMPISDPDSKWVAGDEELLNKWQKIVAKSESQNEAEWKMAIIEADVMLDDLLNQLQLPGDTMADKLKAVEKSDFLTIEYAWEAHKARNMIAHDGGNFILSQREARRIISLYEAVFKEFKMI